MTKILSIEDFINESRGARLIDRNPDRFNSDPLANKKPNTILDKQMQKRFDYTENELKRFCNLALDYAIDVFSDKYISEWVNKAIVFPDGNGDYFKFVPELDVDYDNEWNDEIVICISTFKVLMDVGGVVFPEGLSIIDKVNNAVKNRYRHQMGLVLDENNYDDDEDRMLGLGSANGEKPGMFFISGNGDKFFNDMINQHNGGDYSNEDFDIQATAREHSKYNNVVVELDVTPTLEHYDLANWIYTDNIDENQFVQYAKEFGTYIGEIFIDIFSRASEEYADVLR